MPAFADDDPLSTPQAITADPDRRFWHDGLGEVAPALAAHPGAEPAGRGRVGIASLGLESAVEPPLLRGGPGEHLAQRIGGAVGMRLRAVVDGGGTPTRILTGLLRGRGPPDQPLDGEGRGAYAGA
jgi:hypothetical protein